jgi:hypothetical protein
MQQRLSVVEAALADLKHRHDDLYREVKYELLFKYQELLIAERKRYDRLMAKYNQLMRINQARIKRGKPSSEGVEKRVQQETSGGKEERGWKGMFGRVWKEKKNMDIR